MSHGRYKIHQRPKQGIRTRLRTWTAIHGNSLALIITVITPIILLLPLIMGPTLSFGDIPYADPRVSKNNFLYSWDTESFGTTVRQGLFSLRNTLLNPISINTHGLFLMRLVLPILLIPITYYIFLGKCGIFNRPVRLLASLFALANPIVFGDFSKAQTFWIYLTLPWVLYYTLLLAYRFNLRWRNVVGLAFWLFLSFGILPPIGLSLIAIMVLFALGLLIVQSRRKLVTGHLLGQLLLRGLVVLILFAAMALPYMLIAPAGQEAFQPKSLLGDYYHNYASTQLINTLRLAGNEGNGMTLLGYNGPLITNIFGFYFLGVIIYALMTKKKNNPNALAAVLVGVILLTLGGLHILSTNTEVGVKVFQSQFVVSTIRDPTKIFEVILPFFVLAFAIGLTDLVKTWGHKKTIYCLTIVAIFVYGWPILTGNMGISFAPGKSLSDYTLDKPTREAVGKEKGNNKRAVIIPSAHKDELNYQSVSPSLNTLRIGGALPNTTALVQELQSNINDDNADYIERLLNIAGINNVYVKKDSEEYKQHLFGLLDGVENYRKTSSIFDSALGKPESLRSYDRFSTKSRDIIYAPRRLAAISKQATIHEILPLLDYEATVLQGSNNTGIAMADRYNSIMAPTTNRLISRGKAQLFSTRIVQISYKLTRRNGAEYMQISLLDPVSDKPKQLMAKPTVTNTSQIIIDNKPYDLSAEESTISLPPGKHTVSLGVQKTQNLSGQDPSFESNTHIGNASKFRTGEPNLYGRLSADATDGKSSLLIGSKSHLAFSTKQVLKEVLMKEPGIYKAVFDYKYLSGQSAYAGLFENNALLGDTLTKLKDSDRSWKTQTLFFEAKKNTRATINFYVNSNGDETSETLFDNLRFYKIDTLQPEEFVARKYEPDYDLLNYSPGNDSGKPSNLLSNGSYENSSLVGTSGDATINQEGDAKFRIDRSSDAIHGDKSLRLESRNHTLYYRQELENFEPNRIYKLSFYYKNIRGGRPSFTLWQEGINRPLVYKTVSSNPTWQHFEHTFIPEKGTTGVSLYFYSASSGDKTVNLFDNASITEQPLINNYLELKQKAAYEPDAIVRSYKRLSPTRFTLTLRKGSGSVVLNESYHTGWRAYFVRADQKPASLVGDIMFKEPGIRLPETTHYLANGFANSWVIEADKIPSEVIDKNNEYQLVLEYWPQRHYLVSFLVSVTLAGTCIIFLIYTGIRTRKVQPRSLQPKPSFFKELSRKFWPAKSKHLQP